MAAILSAPPLLLHPTASSFASSESSKGLGFALKQRHIRSLLKFCYPSVTNLFNLCNRASSCSRFLAFAAYKEATETGEVEETENEEKLNDDFDAENGAAVDAKETPASVLKLSLESYKEALANEDKSRLAEIEAFFQSLENENANLEKKIVILSEELLSERDRILRISADFDNFRKRTERDRLSLVSNAQAEMIENLLPIMDNFERAKVQIKVETGGEEKINTSYQSIYKQFLEILGSLGVTAVETVGNAFDPLMHEAVMTEASMEFEEGFIIQEFRKGFKLGDRLLRPSMVKVSAGPGPAKPEQDSSDNTEESGETSKEENAGEAAATEST